MSTPLNEEALAITRVVSKASDAVQRENWDTAESALTEAQDRIGRLLREIGLQKTAGSAPPPSPLKDQR